MVKRVVLAEVNDETSVLGTGGESDGSADLNAERLVGLSVGDARLRSGIVVSAAPDIDGARRGSRPTNVGFGTNVRGIGR